MVDLRALSVIVPPVGFCNFAGLICIRRCLGHVFCDLTHRCAMQRKRERACEIQNPRKGGDKNRPGTYSSKQLQSKDFYGKPSDRHQFSGYSIAASEVCDGKNHTITIPPGNRRKAPFWEKGGLMDSIHLCFGKENCFSIIFCGFVIEYSNGMCYTGHISGARKTGRT